MSPRKSRVAPFLVLALVFIGLAVPLVLGPDRGVFDARDERLFHYPTIQAFAQQWPRLDLSHYPAATTPFYHICMMLAGFVVGAEATHLRLASLVLSLACLLVAYAGILRRGGIAWALLISGLLAASPYFLGSAVRLSTDNAALLFAFTALLLLAPGIRTPRRALVTSLAVLLAILTRQIYAWLLGAYVLAALEALPGPARAALRTLAGRLWPGLLPLAGLAGFLLLWRGLTPPAFAVHVAQGLNPEVLVYVVSLVGLYGSFFGGWFWQMVRERPIRPWVGAIILALAALILLALPVSNEYPLADKTLADRGGALWLVAVRLPMLGPSALVFWVLLPLGLFYLFILARDLAARGELLWGFCFLLWLLANLTGTRVYQKYYEPFLIFWLGYALAVVPARRRWFWLGPVALLAGQAAVTLVRFFG